jgi:hypothetical protein
MYLMIFISRCSVVDSRRFEGNYCHHLQGKRAHMGVAGSPKR